MTDNFLVKKIIGSDAIDRLELILEEIRTRGFYIINVLPVNNDGSLAVIATRATKKTGGERRPGTGLALQSVE